MNRRQTLVLLLLGLVVALFVAFPPYQEAIYSDGMLTPTKLLGYYPLMSPPELENASLTRIDYQRLLLQVGAACAVGFGLYHVSKEIENASHP